MAYKHLQISAPIFNLHVQCEKIYQIYLRLDSSVHPFTNLNRTVPPHVKKINF